MTDLIFEAEITPIINSREIMKLAELAEQIGIDRLGISDVIFYPDTFEIQALCAFVTNRIKIGSLVTNPYTRHPAIIAGAVATLHDISNGRAFIGIGAGAGLGELGVIHSPPARALREAIHIIRELLAGRVADHLGKIYRLPNKNTKLEFTSLSQLHHKVPILIGTRSPKIAELAGELADIIVIGARYISKQQFENYLQWISNGLARAGRNVTDIEIAPRITLCASNDGELAKQSIKLYAAHYLALLRPSDVLIDQGKMNKIVEALRKVNGWYFSPNTKYPKEIDMLIDEEIIDKFAVAGTPDECIAKIRKITTTFGFRSLSLNIAAVRRERTYDGIVETIKSLGEIIQGI
jgi:5,10-methylenetetrahydromethanopterin reductase